MKIFKYLKNVWIVFLDWSRTLIISAMLYNRPCAFLFNMAPTNIGEPFLSVAPLGSWLTELSSIHKLWRWFIIIVASSARPAGRWAISVHDLRCRIVWHEVVQWVLTLKVPCQEEGLHQVFQEMAGWGRQEGDREGLCQDEEVLQGHPCHCSYSGTCLSVWFFCAVNCRYLLVCVVFFVL